MSHNRKEGQKGFLPPFQSLRPPAFGSWIVLPAIEIQIEISFLGLAANERVKDGSGGAGILFWG